MKRAFTLVELLVVVAIIALMLGILMPALGKARSRARQVQCLSNVRSLGTAYHVMTSDQRGQFMRYDDNGERLLWPIPLQPYLGVQLPVESDTQRKPGYYQMTFCPEAPMDYLPEHVPGSIVTGGKDRAWYHWFNNANAYSGGHYAGSYGINGYLYSAQGAQQNPGGSLYSSKARAIYWREGWPDYLAKVPYPDRTPAFCDANWIDGWPTEADPKPASFRGISGSLNPHMIRFAVDRHDFWQNMSFVDGHAEIIRVEDLWAMSWNPLYQPD